MRDLFRKERVIETDYGEYRLEYHMHEIKDEGWNLYGISVLQFTKYNKIEGLFDQAVIRVFSDNLEEAKAFFDTIRFEEVFPVHLYSIADDWKACYSL